MLIRRQGIAAARTEGRLIRCACPCACAIVAEDDGFILLDSDIPLEWWSCSVGTESKTGGPYANAARLSSSAAALAGETASLANSTESKTRGPYASATRLSSSASRADTSISTSTNEGEEESPTGSTTRGPYANATGLSSAAFRADTSISISAARTRSTRYNK